ncbi:PhnD/SsuA/transferrin family substrate-binding protein [Massilia sp. METH4]|uniref:phosphate/phosphite/phosphonate ABC transporter substrate-binding protein n=1 Tax=Massilia sp. METH4 TaxID=3123041 RepID=UPI0030D380DA
MKWIAALPMYDLSPRLRQEHCALQGALFEQADITAPVEHVDDTGPLAEFWRRPDLLLSQTCGYPYWRTLRQHVALLATPCFDVPGCMNGDYSSVLVARNGSGIRTLADARGRVAAVNERHSNSGMNALRHAVAPLARGGRFFRDVAWTGSHAASLRAVRSGAADVAAIDCVTYAYLRREDPISVNGIAILGFTASSPGLPLIAANGVPDALLRRLREALLAPGARLKEAMAALRIRRFAGVDERDYERIDDLEQLAVNLGYPELR